MNAFHLQEFRDTAAAIRAGVARDLAQVLRHTGPENRLGNLYHMADANLHYFFPELSRAQSHALVADILYQQRMALADQRRYSLVEHTRVIDDAGCSTIPPRRASSARITRARIAICCSSSARAASTACCTSPAAPWARKAAAS